MTGIMGTATAHHIILLIGLVAGQKVSTSATNRPPNIIIMLADDLGYGDLSGFGNTTLSTPHIDQLMQEGVKLTHHLAAASVCTPSRAALLTGRYPVRSGMVPSGIIRVNIFVANRAGMLPNETTLAEVAKSVGYKTALVGKWHMGLSKDTYGDHLLHPMNQGFDQYYGHILTNMKDFSGDGERVLLSQRPRIYYQLGALVTLGLLLFVWLYRQAYIGKVSMVIGFLLVLTPVVYFVFIFNNLRMLNGIVMRNHDVVEQPIKLESLMKRYVQEGVEFLEAREKDREPFLLFLSWDHVHTAMRTSKEFKGRSKHGHYGDSVQELDWGTGEIMSTIKNMDIGKNTLVYFTSDNGAHLEESDIYGNSDGGSNGILKGGKAHGAVDGGIRVPTSVWYPGKLPANTTIDEPTMQMDMFTTITNLIGADVPRDRQIDGRDMYSLLAGKERVSPQEFFFHYCGGTVQAVRYRPRSGSVIWKLVYELPEYLPGTQKCTFTCRCRDAIKLERPYLYDITSDPGENRPIDITSDQKYKELAELMIKATEEHTSSIVPVDCRLSFFKMLWRPQMQPCCNFPYCSCVDSKYKDVE
ncbi:steryl-sulfatase-like isoform X1 [Mizuhopecten yessoensis]|uniref:steryl-sulfatase-like isoform X1 n=1 Tax=Mizuhopecten yessoensis TaxID=6573 RepID=UPI000B45AE86|nr:steryl-sulfatase-like isoform X1 [Mizuhopecten yessoensis]